MFRHACMNRAFALVWNEAQSCHVPAPETTSRCGKRSGTTAVAAAVLGLFAASGANALDPGAMPTAGRVTAGQATLA